MADLTCWGNAPRMPRLAVGHPVVLTADRPAPVDRVGDHGPLRVALAGCPPDLRHLIGDLGSRRDRLRPGPRLRLGRRRGWRSGRGAKACAPGERLASLNLL
jgi:hypothetical protein